MNNENSLLPRTYTKDYYSLVSENKEWLALFLIVLTGLLLRLPNLSESLWYDELWATHIRLKNLRTLAFSALYDVNPPFYSVFMFVWIKLFGDSELSVRIPSLIFGISSILLIYTFTSMVTEKNCALLAASLLAVSPVHIWYSQEARPYSALLFFLLLSIISYLKLRDSQKPRTWLVIYFVSLFSCVLTHYYLAAYVLLISIICLREQHRYKKVILMLNAVLLCCMVAWLMIRTVLTSLSTGAGYLRAFTISELWQLFFNWFLFGNSWAKYSYYWAILIVQILFLVLFVHGIALLVKKQERTKHSLDVVMYLFVLPLLLLGFALVGFKNYIERSVLVALPFFYIVVARGVTGFNSRLIRRACITTIAIVSIITVAVYFNRGDEWTVYKPNVDWRSAVDYFNREAKGSSDRLTIFAPTPALELTYYDPSFKQFTGETFQDPQKEMANKNRSPVLRYILENYERLLPEKEQDETAGLFEVYRIRKSHMANIYNTLSNKNTQTFYVINNKYWSGGFEGIYESLVSDSRIKYESMQSFKGIEIYKLNLISSRPGLAQEPAILPTFGLDSSQRLQTEVDAS